MSSSRKLSHDFERGRCDQVLAATLIALAFIAIKIPTLAPRFSDGNVYAYMGSLVAHGQLPYRDFYYSSPPLLPYLYAGFGSLFGWGWLTFAVIPLLCMAANVFLLQSLIGTRGRIASACAAVLFAGSYCALATTDFASDVHPLTTTLLLGLWLTKKDRPLASGAVLGLAALIKIYALVPIAGAVLVLALERRWRSAVRTTLGIAAVFGGVLGAFWLALGEPVIQQTLLNNLGRGVGVERSAILLYFARHDPLMIIAFCAAGLALRATIRDKNFKWTRPALGMLAALAAFYGFYPDLYYLYLLPACALAAALAGTVASSWTARSARWITGLAVALALTHGVYRYQSEQAKAAVIDDFQRLSARVLESTSPGDTIYGDPEVTPLVALTTGRKITGNLVDTNVKFFMQGLFTYEERADDLRRAGVKLVVTKAVIDESGKIVGGPDRVLPNLFFQQYCLLAGVFPIAQDYSSNAVLIWICR